MKSPRIVLVSRLAALCAFASLAPLHAALPAFDGFSYTAGDSLVGSTDTDGDGGSGWVNRWTGSGSTTVVSSATSITRTIDGHTYGGGGSLAFSGGTSTNAAQRLFSSPALTSGGDIYVSFLVQYTGGTGTVATGPFVGVGLLDSSNSVGVDNYILVNNLNGAIGARVNNTSANVPTSTFALGYDTATLVVGRFSGWNGTNYTTTTVWVNPTDDDFGNTSISATVTSSTGSDGAGGLIFRTNNLGASTVLFDDLRVGASWGSVVMTAVPEPGSAALAAGFAALGLVAQRRRSRR